MLKIYLRSGNNIVEGKLSDLKLKKVVWIDCFQPSVEELDKLNKFTGIAVDELKEHVVNYERPMIIEEEKYSLLIFGAPVMKKDNADASSVSIFLCNNNNIVTIRTCKLESFDKIKEEFTKTKHKNFISLSNTVHFMLEKIISSYFEHIEVFQESADRIEATVFENPQKKSIEKTFKIRKSMLLFHKALLANREVILAIEKGHVSRISKKDIYMFKDMREDILQLIDAADTLRNILTSVLDIYTSSVSNQMNQVIKKLTVVASYVLIPTLIASIYGMNFRNMPEIVWDLGYPFSIGLMILSIIAIYIYFRKSKMI